MLKGILSIFGRKKPENNPDKSGFDALEYVKEMQSRTGTEDRAGALPAWALIPYSPYEPWESATSWLGGLPKAPRDTVWPRDSDGTPQHFIAQIDLASLKPEPQTGKRPPGLPPEGALLVFIGEFYSCCVVSASDMAGAVSLAAPEDLPPLRSQGYFSEESTFPQWPVTPIAYLDSTGGRPSVLPDPFAKPEDWIVNCGIAAFEADVLIEELERELKLGLEFFETLTAYPTLANGSDVVRSKSLHYEFVNENGPDLLQRLYRWRDYARSCKPLDPVDPEQLAKILAARLQFHDAMQEYAVKATLKGKPQSLVLDILELNRKKLLSEENNNISGFDSANFERISQEYWPLIAMYIKDWRGHRLFGLEPPPPHNDEDLRGADSVLAISDDALLDTICEHFSGMSIWCCRERMASGQFDSGQLLRHFNG